ncbi:MAG: hypothetical protein KF809_12995 [Chloroflexi bacterium]|nr:hypothetical protein [Chloroflexota bacterium]
MSVEQASAVTIELQGGPQDGDQLTVEGLIPPERLAQQDQERGSYRRLRETGRRAWLYRWVPRRAGHL